ncbi:MAG TPA: flagellar filament capping protein FliD [Phycisphaerae bacterium]|nr:flagellar filament capping protein FliD [Phycisphaerae bacterium]
MSGITSGVGLVSGLPTAQLIDSIIEQASRPKTLLNNQLTALQSQRSSLLELNARLISLKGTANAFTKPSFFNQFSATSSNESVLKATATEGALPGVMNLTVKSLVTSHQLISSGYADANTSPVGAGELTIEFGAARVNPPTRLGDLNGGAGVRRGSIRITDGAGNSADINLAAAVDLQEVIDAINTNGKAEVEARISGNHLIIEDKSGGTEALTIADLKGGFAAADLGIRGSSTSGAVTGTDIVKLTDGTLLSTLNDGNGVRRNGSGLDDLTIAAANGATFNVALSVSTLKDSYDLDVLNNGNGVRLGIVRVTNRLGQTGTVDLSGAETIGDVRELFNAAVDDETGEDLNVELKIGVGISGVAGLSISDNTEPPEGTEKDLVIEDVSGYAARDLGIAQRTSSASVLGNGIYRITSIGDVVRAINHAEGNNGAITASLTADGIQLTDNTDGPDDLTVTAVDNAHGRASRAAKDLGIAGTLTSGEGSRPLIGGLNTVLLSTLNGGNGLELGSISFTARDGSAPVTVDFAGATTLQDVIERINDNVPGIHAEVNGVGTGIALVDTTGATAGDIVVADTGGGTLAEQLGISGTFTDPTVRGANLQRRYLGENSELAKLNAGRGVRAGVLQVTTSDKRLFAIEIKDSARTLGDVIDAINTAGAGYGVTAALNATGDGIAVTDANGGTEPLTIADADGGSTAADLRLAGQAEYGESTIDGSYEIRIQIDADDTLNAVAGKIRDASQDVTASVFNDGASGQPYRLSVNSALSGRRGELLFDAGGTGLNMSTLVAAQDAVVLVGGRDASNPIVVSSSSNTISGAIPGVELELTSVSDETVTVSTARDLEGIVSSISKFVDDYNSVIDRIDEVTAYNPDTEERAVLQGDATVSLIEQRLTSALVRRFSGAPPQARTLSSVGIEFGDGAHLSFDEDKFREKYNSDPAAVTQLFTAEGGVGAVLSDTLDQLTEEGTGILARRDAVIGSQVDTLNERIASMDEALARKRDQLERQYANLESVLAGLQDQQSALSQLAQLAG